MARLAPALEEREFSFSDEEFHFLAQFANQRTGIVLSDNKKDMVYSRLVRRLRALKLKSFADYCALIQTDNAPDEVVNLVNAITTNLTSFFREYHHFEHLRNDVLLPLLMQKKSTKRLRIWSSACSAGMEPYSIAMVLKSVLPDLKSWDAKILATDIDTNILKTAMAGEYAIEQLDNIPNEYLIDVLVNESLHKIKMSPTLQSMITFKSLNLMEDWPMKGPFDVIFCRNVVIYFDKPTQSKLFARMADILTPDGWLYIGHSENLFQVCNRFELVGRTVYRKVGV